MLLEAFQATPMFAGFAYVAAWLIGLAVHSSGPALDDSARVVASHYAAHRTAALVQSILIHGIAAVALVIVVMAINALARRHGRSDAGRTVMVAGVAGAAVSLVQMVLGVTLAATANISHANRAGTLFDAINRLDGLKMLAFAVMAAGGVVLARRQVLPRWLGVTGVLLVVAAVIGGAGYLLLSATLGSVAIVGLVLLWVWVGGSGFVVSQAE